MLLSDCNPDPILTRVFNPSELESKHEFVIKVRDLVKSWPRLVFSADPYSSNLKIICLTFPSSYLSFQEHLCCHALSLCLPQPPLWIKVSRHLSWGTRMRDFHLQWREHDGPVPQIQIQIQIQIAVTRTWWTLTTSQSALDQPLCPFLQTGTK